MSDSLKFINGPLDPSLIAEEIRKVSVLMQVGAHSIFIGQVRNDLIDGREVKAIEYTAYEAMAVEKAVEIVKTSANNFQMEKVKIFHSLGKVRAGEICLFVLAVSKHRKSAIEGCHQVVEKIKQELPIWGKEIFTDESHQWKVNK